MDILIKNMKMPEDCDYCPIRSAVTTCGFDREHCTLIALPPHGRLIDADLMKECCFMGDKLLKDALLEWIDVQRTVIEAEDGDR